MEIMNSDAYVCMFMALGVGMLKLVRHTDGCDLGCKASTGNMH